MKQFEKILVRKPKRALHDFSHERKFTCDMGYLIPVLCEEVLPGDDFQIDYEAFMRFVPLLTPIMHRINVYIHTFFVPYRIIWDEFEDFITGGQDGDDETTTPMFTGTMANFYANPYWRAKGQLADYLGIPWQQYTNDPGDHPAISQLPFRAYHQIWNDYYRDPTLEDEFEFSKDSLDIDVETTPGLLLSQLKKRCWEKDYFTSALPWAQRGAEVTLPLGTYAPVTGHPIIGDQSGTPYVGSPTGLNVNANSYIEPSGVSWASGATMTGIGADLSEATSATINELRVAFATQRWLEKNARGGYRYIEQMLSHFGVRSDDARLQRSEYIGGGKLNVQISEVLQMSETGTTPQGTMAGHGISSGVTNTVRKSFKEHGFIMSILSVVPRTAYMQGIPRYLLKQDKFEHYQPDFAHVGEQAVYDVELYLESGVTTDEFGYQPRYEEYRTRLDSAHGDMREDYDFWHFARQFVTAPALDDAFVQCTPGSRIFPVEITNQKCIFQTYAKIKAIRPVAKFGTPM